MDEANPLEIKKNGGGPKILKVKDPPHEETKPLHPHLPQPPIANPYRKKYDPHKYAS